MFNFFKVNEELFFKELLSDNIDLYKIQKYIDRGIDINKRDEKGRTILFQLAAKRKIDALRILIKNGAKLTAEDRFSKTVLDEVCERNDGVMVRFFLDNGFDINHKNSSGRTISQDVAIDGNLRIFQVLMI